MSTPNRVSVVCVIEKFDYVSTPVHVSVITVEGEVWICRHSYSCACYSY